MINIYIIINRSKTIKPHRLLFDNSSNNLKSKILLGACPIEF
jgi:hypothetical protein